MIYITEEKISLNDLSQVKGIGKKTLERIKQELLSEEDENNKYELEVGELPLNKIFNIECKKGMQKYIPDESLDAIVTDPPYNLSFMGKDWDTIGTPFQFQEWNKEWAKIAYKKLKPGGYMLIFGGTRTYHRMVSGIEDVRFEVKDMIEWMYGTGMPKGYNISKGFESLKDNGSANTKDFKNIKNKQNQSKQNLGYNKMHYRQNSQPDNYKLGGKFEIDPTCQFSQKWKGWNTQLKPSHEPILLVQKPREGTYCENIEKYGVGGINIDDCRVKFKNKKDKEIINNKSSKNPTNNYSKKNYQKYGDYDKDIATPAYNKGRFPANLLLTHHPDCEYKGEKKVKGDKGGIRKAGSELGQNSGWNNHKNKDTVRKGHADKDGMETVEDWNCHPYCPIRRMNEQSGVSVSSGGSDKASKNTASGNIYGKYEKGYESDGLGGYGDNGGAARYFNQFHFIDEDFFKYTTKASKKERTMEGKVDNNCPTVKPIELMQWLVRLVTPKGGVVLDPFMGSGTTLLACILENINYIGMDKNEHHYDIAKQRIENINKLGG